MRTTPTPGATQLPPLYPKSAPLPPSPPARIPPATAEPAAVPPTSQVQPPTQNDGEPIGSAAWVQIP
jgi:hypothetical protein